jgi:hypothetical protein
MRAIDECIEVIGRANSKVFSAADVSNLFWTLSTWASDRPYTAFTIPGTGQFQWCRMAQGLAGSPGYFSRLMDLIMAGARKVLTYIDDLLMHSKNHSEHLVHLANALDRVGKANLRLNLTKFIFGASKVNYLSHTITSADIKPGTDKSDAMRLAPIPRTVKEVQSFNGLANYFQQYIVQFATKAAPLFALTKQDSHWKVGKLPPAALASFERLGKEILSRPLMAFPNGTGTYHLFVDACLKQWRPLGCTAPGSAGWMSKADRIRLTQAHQLETQIPNLSR